MAQEDPVAVPAQEQSASDAAANGALGKLRAACDECRTKKLKCTGEHPKCSRCERENITCVYSRQKQMGRPKKRARTDQDSPPKDGYGDVALWDQSLNLNTNNLSFDQAPFESAFTPGGSLQPWLKNAGDWGQDFSMPEGGHTHGSDHALPALTPDNSSSSSPPLLNLPAELQNSHHSHSMHPDASTGMLLDPALGGTAHQHQPPGMSLSSCACLSTMYLTLNTLQTLNDTTTFPFALHPLRDAMQTASTVLTCEECPQRFITAIQNTQLVGTLLMSIAERYSKVLEHITTEANRAEEAGETKKFRLQDLNTSTSHLHAGGLGCIAAFSINLSPTEWRSMCKKVIRAEIHGPSEGNECCCYFMGVIAQMEERQDRWHKRPAPGDFPKDPVTGKIIGPPRHSHADGHGDHEHGDGEGEKKEEHLCLKLVGFAKRLVGGFDWS